jgi:hypothetical protein
MEPGGDEATMNFRHRATLDSKIKVLVQDGLLVQSLAE